MNISKVNGSTKKILYTFYRVSFRMSWIELNLFTNWSEWGVFGGCVVRMGHAGKCPEFSKKVIVTKTIE